MTKAKKIPANRKLARKAKKKEAAKKAAPKIEPGDYWEMRTTLEEYEHSLTKIKMITKTKELLNEKIELLKLRLELANRALKEENKTMQNALEDYNSIVGKIEGYLGISLINSEIDPIDYSVTHNIGGINGAD